MYSWNWEKLEIIHKEFYYIKKAGFSTSISETNENVVSISWLVSYEVCLHIHYFFGVVRIKNF